MTSGEVGDLGWPFLVAAGRRRDHAVLVAPDFLVERQDYGMLGEAVPPGREGDPPGVTVITTMSGQVLAVTHRTHLLLPEDLAGPEDLARPGSEDSAVPVARDEHNRPLRLLLGFVSLSCRDLDEVDVDLDRAEAVVMDAYRDFLGDEEGFAVAASTPRALQSRPAPAATRSATLPTVTRLPPGPTTAARQADRARRGALPRQGRRRGVGVLLLLLAAAVALGAVFLSQREARTPEPCTTTTSAGSGVAPGGSATAPCPTVTPGGAARPGLRRG